MSGLNCKRCGHKLHLGYDSKIIKTENGTKINFLNTPLLICGHCDSKYVPYMTNELIQQACEVMEEPMQETDNKVDVEQQEIYCDFDVIKREICDERFIAEKVKFLYDKDDYYFIPGLIRPWNTGFLTPVFFNIEVLLKYIHHPEYGLDIGADTFGYIYKGDEQYVTFGINENNKVLMWLGDIVKLNIEEQFYLRSENIISDHSIGSEFYEAEIETCWAQASAERTLLEKRRLFNEKVRSSLGLEIAQLDTETVRIAKNIRKLIVNTNDAFKDLMISLNELLVEAINNKDIRKKIKEGYPELKEEIKEKKGIKLLQIWLEKNTQGIDVNAEIAPLFVLYDLRLVSAHLYSDDKREEMLKFCCLRLGLDEGERDYIIISNTLVEKLTEMYIRFNDSLII